MISKYAIKHRTLHQTRCPRVMDYSQCQSKPFQSSQILPSFSPYPPRYTLSSLHSSCNKTHYFISHFIIHLVAFLLPRPLLFFALRGLDAGRWCCRALLAEQPATETLLLEVSLRQCHLDAVLNPTNFQNSSVLLFSRQNEVSHRWRASPSNVRRRRYSWQRMQLC